MSQDLAVTADSGDAVTQYDLGQVRMLWEEFELRSRRHKEDGLWLEQFKSRAKEVSNNADEFLLDGKVVAQLVRGQLNVSRIAAEQPELHQRFMRKTYEFKFDRGGFERAEPDLYKQYQSRRFCVIGE